MYIHLTRINFETNTHRWYSVSVTSDLFGRLSLVTEWGSLKSAYYKQQIKHPATLGEALATADKIVQSKLKKGYKRLSHISKTKFLVEM